MELREGTIVEGRYRLLQLADRGGFGEIWKAADERMHGRVVALKLLLGAQVTSPDVVARFERESALLASLDHPFIVLALDRGTWQGRPYYVMRWVEGITLARWLVDARRGSGQTDLGQVRLLFGQICAAVGAAHAREIVHRDLKPANVMITRDATGSSSPLLLDFGIARDPDHSHTVMGSVLMTPEYAAPEQALGDVRAIGPATDVFALATLLVEMLAGTPYATNDERVPMSTAVLARHGHIADDLARRRADVPASVWRCIASALDVLPSARPADALAFARALDASWSAAPTNEPARRAPEPPARRSEVPSVFLPHSMVMPPKAPEARRHEIKTVVDTRVPVFATPPAPREPPPSVFVPPSMQSAPPPARSSAPAASKTVQLPPTRRHAWKPITGVLVASAVVGIGLGYGAMRRALVSDPHSFEPQSTASPFAESSPPQESAPTAPAVSPCPEGMSRIAGAQFWMGSQSGPVDELPAHLVTLSDYCIDRTEVTVAAYQQCVSAGSCALTTDVSFPNIRWDQLGQSRFCNGQAQGRGNHPMNCVDWANADAYCRWRGARLPTEAEWEYAASHGQADVYFQTNRGNACGSECASQLTSSDRGGNASVPGSDAFATTAPVGSFNEGVSGEGVYDLIGNVAEWVQDWYAPSYAGGAAETSPQGPASGVYRVQRGGSWMSGNPDHLRARYRDWDPPEARRPHVGFRCAR